MYVVQEVDSRFLQRHQGLILSADRLSMVMSIDTHDQIEILKYTLFYIRMLFFQPRLNILIFLPILGWKYSCSILKL